MYDFNSVWFMSAGDELSVCLWRLLPGEIQGLISGLMIVYMLFAD